MFDGRRNVYTESITLTYAYRIWLYKIPKMTPTSDKIEIRKETRTEVLSVKLKFIIISFDSHL